MEAPEGIEIAFLTIFQPKMAFGAGWEAIFAKNGAKNVLGPHFHAEAVFIDRLGAKDLGGALCDAAGGPEGGEGVVEVVALEGTLQTVENGLSLARPFGIDELYALGLAFPGGFSVLHGNAPVPERKADFGMDFPDALLEGGVGLEPHIHFADLGQDGERLAGKTASIDVAMLEIGDGVFLLMQDSEHGSGEDAAGAGSAKVEARGHIAIPFALCRQSDGDIDGDDRCRGQGGKQFGERFEDMPCQSAFAFLHAKPARPTSICSSKMHIHKLFRFAVWIGQRSLARRDFVSRLKSGSGLKNVLAIR